MKVLIDMSDHLYSEIKSEKITRTNMLTDAVYNGTPLPKTNGEVIKAIFPNAEVTESLGEIAVYIKGNGTTLFSFEWWNAEYKGGE